MRSESKILGTMASCVNSVVKVISTPTGRDKVHILLEKSTKVFLYLLASRGPPCPHWPTPELVQGLTSFANQVMLARGINRLTSAVLPLQSLLDDLHGAKIHDGSVMDVSKSDTSNGVRYGRILCALGWLGFFYYDNRIFLGLSGMLKTVDYPTAISRANKFWLFCLLLTLGLSAMQINKLNEKKDNKDNRKKIKLAKLKTIATLMEIMCAARGSGLIQFNDGLFEGLLFSSGMIGIRSILLS
eukprot:1061324_1